VFSTLVSATEENIQKSTLHNAVFWPGAKLPFTSSCHHSHHYSAKATAENPREKDLTISSSSLRAASVEEGPVDTLATALIIVPRRTRTTLLMKQSQKKVVATTYYL
jgi:hypothetical protein